MTFTILLSERMIEVSSLYEETKHFCREYLIDGFAEIRVQTSVEDIIFEREKSNNEAELEGRKVVGYSDEYLETLAVYRKIAEALLDYNTLLFHGSVIAVDGVAYLFTAKSGTGKSTHTKLWREYFSDRAVMINDDKPLIKITPEGAIVYGTPWDGKHHLSTNTSAPLKAICILERSETNRIRSVTKQEAYAMLLQQVYRPKVAGHPELMAKTLELVDAMTKQVKLYRLGCNMDPEAARIAWEGMQ